MRIKDRGITLVALVVTIVVLLILAGISMMYTLGDKSIIKKAQEAKNKTENAIGKEQEELKDLVNLLDEEEITEPEDTTRYKITIQYVGEDNNTIAPNKIIEGVKNGEKYITSNYAISITNYAYISATKDEIIINGKDENITLRYGNDVLIDLSRDTNGNLPGDGIPDYLQYTVTYSTVSGTCSFESTAVTKMLNGVPSENGVAKLEEKNIPVVLPKPGYSEPLTWVPSRPQIGTEITGNTIYTGTFSNAPVTPPTAP